MDRDRPAEAAACCERSKERGEEEYRDLLNRLSRIEGQIRGIRGMVERSAYCIDILNQVSAAGNALNSFTKVLLASHIRSCVAEDVREGREDKLEELVNTLQRLMK
ncbi:MAG: metal-sensing transcriptional repressor [Oscillospiraceae bacterium]|nr:metal-sensing transcriptional repressor [Oscillospiraceae bacterium]